MVDRELVLKSVVPTEKKNFTEFFEAENVGTYYDWKGCNILCKYVQSAKPIEPLVVQHLLSLDGLDVNHTDQFGFTCLLLTAKAFRVPPTKQEVYDLMFKYGADVN